MSTSQQWWVPDETEVWALATQSGAKQPNGCVNFCLHSDKSMVAFPIEKCIQVVGSTTAPEDLVFLQDVNQATILNCIRDRFSEKKIYTSVGSVLMTVNPFEHIPGIYGPKVIEKYSDANEKKLLAHVYEIPSRAYESMCRAGGNQSILISGESGAGKTEATKQCLSYLTVVANSQAQQSQQHNNNHKPRPPNALTVSEIANRIIAASPILEAFGNAKTIRNPNSSRFGKWMVLNFDSSNAIHSSNVVSYLLEKSRVTKRDSKERNYHIFYQVLRGMDRELLGQWRITPEARHYLYLQQDDGKEPVNLDDAAQYSETEAAFTEMGFSQLKTHIILKVVCGILQLGNVCFTPINDGEGSEVANPAVVESISELLCVNPQILTYALSNRSIESRKSMIAIVLNPQKACESRDSLARQLYDKVFLAIIHTINSKSRMSDDGVEYDRCIGLLDIFGFEIFVENSFEQVCINYCNEMLQNHFNFVIFTAEKNLYLQEGIVCETIEFRDNIDVIREIEGMFKSLDEEARIPKGTSKTWFDKLKRGAKLANVSFPNRRVGQVFVVKHYAGDVDYNPLGLLEKNTETLSNDLVGAMLSSSEALIQSMFDVNSPINTSAAKSDSGTSGSNSNSPTPTPTPNATATAKRGANTSALATKSISWNFTTQLTTLMTMLKKTDSHFIRCVKSNDQCVPAVFDSKLVHKQLLYSGVFEVVKIQQSGLPCRLSHVEFLSRYKCLAPSRIRYNLRNSKELITYLTSARYELPLAQMGRTRTFFKSQEQRILENARNDLFRSAACKIQTLVRRIACSYYFNALRAEYRVFMHAYTELILAPAQVAYDNFNTCREAFAHIKHYPILLHVSNRLHYNLSILSKRVELVADAKQRILVRTEQSVLSLQDIVTAAIDLDLTQHNVVIECKNIVKMYFRALDFIDTISVPLRLRGLGMTHINDGIECLNNFSDLLPGCVDSIQLAVHHKQLVEAEIQNIVLPLRKALYNAYVVYDANTGNLRQKLRAEDHKHTLRALVQQHSTQSNNFTCSDSQLMFNDCANFITVIDDFVPICDAIGTLSFIQSRDCVSSTNDVFISQCDEFRKWADMQMTTIKLKECMKHGRVSLSATGSEKEVVVGEIQAVLDQLSVLRDPTDNLKAAIRAGTWIVKLRQAYLDADFELLEQLVMQADEDGVTNLVFDDYAECIEELNSCQWQVIYHGLTADAVHVLSEACFTLITLQAEHWSQLVVDLPDNMMLVETIHDFAVEALCPRLYKLIPLLENTLQLRSLMYQRDLELSKVLHTSFLSTHSECIEEHKLGVAVRSELKRCGELIRKIELEEELDHLLTTISTSVYAYEGVNDMPLYNSLYSQANSIADLEAVLADFDTLHSSYHPSLQEKIDLSTTLLKGRKRMTQSELNSDIIWKDCLLDFEEGMSACLKGTTLLPDYIKTEYEIIVGEMIRRSMVQGYMQILSKVCVVGEADVNISVDEQVLIPLFHQYNHVSQLMSAEYDEYPNNIKALTKFTSAMLRLRKLVVDNVYDSSTLTLLTTIQSMDHGGGRDVPTIPAEINKVHSEYTARSYITNLRYALENVPVSIPDNPEDTSSMVDLAPLREASGWIISNKGKHSKQLKTLADDVISILDSLVHNNFSSVPPALVDSAAAAYVAYGLNSTAIERIFRYTRVHNFLKNLCDAMRDHTSPEQLFTSINSVRNSLLSVPERFIPWLKAAYIYCESVSAYATEDWIKMVESTRKLEECIQILSGVRIVTETHTSTNNSSHSKLNTTNTTPNNTNTTYNGSREVALNESIFLELMHAKATTGYSAALRIKSLEQQQRTVESINSMTSEQLNKLKIQTEDEVNPYGIAQLRLAGYDDAAILDVKFPVKFLWALDFDAVLLRKKGFKAGKLLAAGYSVTSLYQAGFSVLKLKAAGCSIDALRTAGVTFDQLRSVGFPEAEILNGTLPTDFLKATEYDASKLLRMGLALRDLVSAGLTALELRAAGFSVMELKQAGITSIAELRKAGFDLVKLKAAFDIHELHDAGYSFSDLLQSGVDEKSLIDAGFGAQLEMQALRELYVQTNGPLWKIRLNWCTSKPLSQWYGVRTEKDLQQNERVVALDLTDNHLMGIIPEKLWCLSKLRSLHLGLNFLTGAVPPLLAHLIRSNNITTDLVVSPGGLGGSMGGSIGMSGMGGGSVHDTHSHIHHNNSVPFSPNPNPTGRLDFDANTPYTIHNLSNSMTDISLMANTSADYFHTTNANTLYGTATSTNNVNIDDLNSIDRSALMDLYHATNGPKWHNKLNWGSTLPISEWKGVTVNKQGYVAKLTLPSNNLNGSIPMSIYYLESLRELDLRLNQLHGPVPETIGHMKQLTHVYLQSNRLSGAIPSTIGELSQLVLLDLRCNQLSDHVPKSFAQLKKLKYLGLKSNLLKSRPFELQQLLPWSKIVT